MFQLNHMPLIKKVSLNQKGLPRYRLGEAGVLHLVPLFILLVGIIASVYLVSKNGFQIFKPKATAENVSFESGQCLSSRDGRKVLTCGVVNLKFISPLDAGQTTDAGFQIVKTAYATGFQTGGYCGADPSKIYDPDTGSPTVTCDSGYTCRIALFAANRHNGAFCADSDGGPVIDGSDWYCGAAAPGSWLGGSLIGRGTKDNIYKSVPWLQDPSIQCPAGKECRSDGSRFFCGVPGQMSPSIPASTPAPVSTPVPASPQGSNTPILLFPNGVAQNDADRKIHFYWSKVGSASSYNLVINNGVGGNNILHNTGDSNYYALNLSDFDEGKTYRWWVTALDKDRFILQGGTSETFSFTVNKAAPAAPAEDANKPEGGDCLYSEPGSRCYLGSWRNKVCTYDGSKGVHEYNCQTGQPLTTGGGNPTGQQTGGANPGAAIATPAPSAPSGGTTPPGGTQGGRAPAVVADDGSAPADCLSFRAPAPGRGNTPEGGRWQPNCTLVCSTNSDCPVSTDPSIAGDPGMYERTPQNPDGAINKTNWCYGFGSNFSRPRCLMLMRNSTTSTPTPTPGTPGGQLPASSAAPAASASPAGNAASPTPTPPAGARVTTGFRFSERPLDNVTVVAVPFQRYYRDIVAPYVFNDARPGTKFIYAQFQDNQGNITNANPYPIQIELVLSSAIPTAAPQSGASRPACPTDTVTPEELRTICGVKTYDKCIDQNGATNDMASFCSDATAKFRCYFSKNDSCRSSANDTTYNYFCSSCPNNIAAAQNRVPCAKPGEAGTKNTCGITTYDNCIDDAAQTGDQLCKGTATKFKCSYSRNSLCISGANASDYNYSCTACNPADADGASQ